MLFVFLSRLFAHPVDTQKGAFLIFPPVEHWHRSLQISHLVFFEGLSKLHLSAQGLVYGIRTMRSLGFVFSCKRTPKTEQVWSMFWCVKVDFCYLYFRFEFPFNFFAAGSKILVALFMAHYFHRTFFYAISIREGKPTPFIFHLLAFLFCTLNGYMQSRSILGFRGPLPHFLDPVFVFGIALFCVGMFINIQSDSILRGLRADGSRNYKIPYGGLFDYVSSANYFGEILEWWGFALAAWQLQSFSFAIFTMANLIPRAVAHHQWYLEKFRGEYPRDRYAVIPFLL